MTVFIPEFKAVYLIYQAKDMQCLVDNLDVDVEKDQRSN